MSYHIMVDLETLDTTRTSHVLSIGAVGFNIETGHMRETFYRRIDENQPGRTISRSTVAWWMRQSMDAQLEAFAPTDRHPLHRVMQEFVMEYAPHAEMARDHCIWANDPQFDLEIMRDVFKEQHLIWPWGFRSERSFRTIKHAAWPDGGLIPVEPAGTAHNALDDAIYQAKVVCEAWRLLRSPFEPKVWVG